MGRALSRCREHLVGSARPAHRLPAWKCLGYRIVEKTRSVGVEPWLVESSALPLDGPYKHCSWAHEIHRMGGNYLEFSLETKVVS
jgi:hypothetical protein